MYTCTYTHKHAHVHVQLCDIAHAVISLTYSFISLAFKDGRGFITQRKDVVPGLAEVERGLFGGEREISSSQFATVSNDYTAHAVTL